MYHVHNELKHTVLTYYLRFALSPCPYIALYIPWLWIGSTIKSVRPYIYIDVRERYAAL